MGNNQKVSNRRKKRRQELIRRQKEEDKKAEESVLECTVQGQINKKMKENIFDDAVVLPDESKPIKKSCIIS